MRLTWRAVFAVLLTLTAVLFVQAAATLWLQRHGVHGELAANLPRLVGLPVVIGATWFVLRRCAIDARAVFALPAPAVRLLLSALMIGVLFRVASWAAIHVSAAFGWLASAAAAPPRAFAVGWGCPPPLVLVVSAVAWVALVPLSEELVHRGVVLSRLAPCGCVPAVTVSAIVFMLFHQPEGFGTALIAGLLLGLEYWTTRSLWVPIATHAAYDGLLIVDTLCLWLAWNPPPGALPAWDVAAAATATLAMALAGIAALLTLQRTGVREPRPAFPGADSAA